MPEHPSDVTTGESHRQPSLWRRWDSLRVACLVAAPLLVMSDGGMYTTLVTAGCYALVVLAMQWVVGYAGILVIGYPALFGAGAYLSAILTTRYGWNFFAAVAVATATATILAALLGPTLRLHGVYLALGTLALVFIFAEAVAMWPQLTGGASGLVGIPSMPLVERTGPTRHIPYVVVWSLVCAVVVVSRRLADSRAGRGLFALREDEDVARSVGVRAARARFEIWLASAALSGLAGAIYAHHIRYLSPGQFGIRLSLELLAMLIVGGSLSPAGAVLGTLIFVMVPQVFEPVGEYRSMLFGAVLLAVVALAPGGLATLPDRLRRVVSNRQQVPA